MNYYIDKAANAINVKPDVIKRAINLRTICRSYRFVGHGNTAGAGCECQPSACFPRYATVAAQNYAPVSAIGDRVTAVT